MGTCAYKLGDFELHNVVIDDILPARAVQLVDEVKGRVQETVGKAKAQVASTARKFTRGKV